MVHLFRINVQSYVHPSRGAKEIISRTAEQAMQVTKQIMDAYQTRVKDTKAMAGTIKTNRISFEKKAKSQADREHAQQRKMTERLERLQRSSGGDASAEKKGPATITDYILPATPEASHNLLFSARWSPNDVQMMSGNIICYDCARAS